MRSMVEGAMRAPKKTVARARTLRRQLTLPEVLLWQELRGNRLAGLRIRRQHPIGSYVLDFYCSAARLAIEVDGASHDHPDRAEHDRRRDAWLAERGIRVLRFHASTILSDRHRQDALETIVAVASCKSPLHHAAHGPPPPLRG